MNVNFSQRFRPALLRIPSTLAVLASAILLAGTMIGFADDPRSTDQPQGLNESVPQHWALTGATLIPEPGVLVEDAVIVIRGGRIVASGKDVEIPVDARRIDLSDRFVYAGLIDAFTEQDVSLSTASTAKYWNSQIRPRVRVAGHVTRNTELTSQLRKQGVAARLVAPSDGILKGFGAVVLTSDHDDERNVVRADVTQHARLTAAHNFRGQYPSSPMGAVALARQTFLDAAWYRDAWRVADADASVERPDRNADLAALNEMTERGVPLVVDTSNELFCLRADRFAREFGLNLIVRGSGNEYRRLDDIRQTGRAIIVPVNFPQPPNVATIEAAQDVTTESLLHWDLAPENPGRLIAAGVRVALTSHGLKDRATFLAQVRKAVQRGLNSDEALRALTVTPAELLGVDDQLGRVAAGRVASLVVTNGPLFDANSKVIETWVAGERFEFDPQPARDVAGTWTLKISSPPEPVPGQMDLLLKTDGKLSGHLLKPAADKPTEIAFKQAVLNGTRLSVTFAADELGRAGIARLTIVFAGVDRPAYGSVDWPDGGRSSVRLDRSDKQNGAGSSDAPMPQSTADSSDSSVPTDPSDPAKSETAPVAASFPINYPLGAFGRAGLPDQPQQVAITNVTVWTCGPAGIIRDATVIIGEGRITDVGRIRRLPDGIAVIDGHGMHLSPGLIDCHSHFATDGGINESGQAVTSEVRIGDFIDCDDINIYRQLAGGVTSSNILHGSANPIGGQNQVIKLRWGASDNELRFENAPSGIKFALGENVKQSNWGDEFTSRYPQTRMGVEQIFRDRFIAAKEYRQRWRLWNEEHRGLPPRRDLELEAIAEILEHRRWVHCHSYRQDEILALIRLADEFGFTIGTFQHILEGYKVADEMARHGAMGSAFSDWWAYKFEVSDAIPYAGALMHRAGVVVSFNSDDQELARHLNHEAAKAVKYGGVDPHEAFKFVTLNPAKQLRIDDRVGSIEPGKDADFVLWSGSPLSAMSRCEQTWIDGRRWFDRETDLELRAENQHMRTVLIQKILASGEAMRKPGEGDDDPASLWPRADLFCHAHDHDGHDHGGR